MDDLHAAGVLHELQIPCASSKPSGTGVPQCISGTLHNTAVVKLKSAVLITNLSDFSSDALHTPVPKPAVVGVAVSPCSSMVAAYSTDALYFARLNGDGQLHEAGQLAGIKSVQWCPGRAALAVFYQQADPVLLVLAEQQSHLPMLPLQRLPAPRSATFGARCATWLPSSSSSGSYGVAALLAAWPSDMLLYYWSPTAHGAVDWKHPQIHKFLPGWPGPARALAAVPATHIRGSSNTDISISGSSSSCVVLGTVDAQLSLDAQGDSQPGQQQQGLDRSVGGAAPTDRRVEVLGAYPPHSGGGGVLSRLLNIHHHAAVDAAVASNASSGSMSSASRSVINGAAPLSSAHLCMLQVNLADFAADSGTSSSNGLALSQGLTEAGKYGSQLPTAIALERLPLPNILAVHGDVVAVASTKGAPVITLCALSSGGLRSLQTVSIPLPAAAGPDVTKARLEGLVLAAAQQQPGYAYEISSSDSDISSTGLFPGVDLAGGGTVSALLSDPGWSLHKTHHHHQQQQQLLPDLVALITCLTGQPQTGQFASFGSKVGSPAAAADTYLLKCRVQPIAPALLQLQQQQQQHEIVPCCPTPTRQQKQQQLAAGAACVQHRPVNDAQQQQQQHGTAVLSPRQHAAAPSPRQQSPLVSPRHRRVSSNGVASPRQQRASCNGVAYTVLHKTPAGPMPTSPTSQQQQQHKHGSDSSDSSGSSYAVQPQQRQKRGSDSSGSSSSSYALQPKQQQKRGSDSSSSSYTSIVPSVVHRCPWLRNMQLKEDEEEQQRLQQAAAAKEAEAAAAIAKASSDALSQQQLEAMQQQMNSFLQQRTTESCHAGIKLDRMLKGLTAVQANMQQQAGSREYLEATVTALGKMQSTMECILAALQQQQQHRDVSQAAGGPEAAEAISMLQHTMEALLQSMHEQQQLLSACLQVPTAAAVGGREAEAATEAFSGMQATLDDMLQLMQQQQQQQTAVTGGPAGLETSPAAALDRMQSTLEQVLQALQQQPSTVSSPPLADNFDAATAFSKMQLTMEGVLTILQQQQQAMLLTREPPPASVTAAAFGTLQASIERLTDTLEQHQKQQQAAVQAAQKQQAAVAAAALANLQVSLESRLDSMLHQQQLLLQEASQKDQAVVGAMAQMQVGIERKLDAMHHTLKDMVVKLAGLEEELAELEQQQ